MGRTGRFNPTWFKKQAHLAPGPLHCLGNRLCNRSHLPELYDVLAVPGGRE